MSVLHLRFIYVDFALKVVNHYKENQPLIVITLTLEKRMLVIATAYAYLAKLLILPVIANNYLIEI